MCASNLLKYIGLPRNPLGIFLAVFPDMDFHPVYRLSRTNGSFSRIGSLLEPCRQEGPRSTPHNLEQAMAFFEQGPGEVILLGPRCAPGRGEASAEEGEIGGGA